MKRGVSHLSTNDCNYTEIFQIKWFFCLPDNTISLFSGVVIESVNTGDELSDNDKIDGVISLLDERFISVGGVCKISGAFLKFTCGDLIIFSKKKNYPFQ